VVRSTGVFGAAPALIFDCDGVLADTEFSGHLPAFNQMFEEFGLPVHWSRSDYLTKVRIGGGKERLASLLTADFVQRAGLPSDREGQLSAVEHWHRRKSEIYRSIIRSGGIAARPGVVRLTDEAHEAGWLLAVASTSAEDSVRSVLGQVVGEKRIASFLVVAGDAVTAKKPAPDIYQRALELLEVPATNAVAVEDSQNGVESAVAAGLHCLVTVGPDTADQDFSAADLVVSGLGDPGGPAALVLENRSSVQVADWVTLDDLAGLLSHDPSPDPRNGAGMPITHATPQEMLEGTIWTIAETVIANEAYFGDLDSVVGDGDFGFSLARGFEAVRDHWTELGRADAAAFLRSVALIITSRMGGTSGPLWGTAFLRASAVLTQRDGPLDGVAAVAMLRAGSAGIMQRGGASLGDKTLLDALVPATDAVEQVIVEGGGLRSALAAASAAAAAAVTKTAGLQARRGRASYSGERSIGSVDPGAQAVAIIFEALSAAELTGHLAADTHNEGARR
jgi:dihydroxyacetone kinase phosphoprotein-dependent L subunit